MSSLSHRLSQTGESLGAALPPLLVKAEKIAATVILGVHGRKAAGPGESFWQYRPYSFGDSTARVDWHRSARADRVFIRENEWESANTLWVWANTSQRMDFKSHLATVSKRERAQVIALAMASLAARGHERLGAMGSTRSAGHGRNALQRAAEWISEPRDIQLPQGLPLQRRAAAVLVSDFLDDLDDARHALTGLAASGIKGHMVQIADPAEETLPYDGRVEFLGLDTKASYLASKTENLRADYIKAYTTHRSALRDMARRLGWSFIVHRTDEAPTRCILALHQLISGDRHAARSGRALT